MDAIKELISQLNSQVLDFASGNSDWWEVKTDFELIESEINGLVSMLSMKASRHTVSEGLVYLKSLLENLKSKLGECEKSGNYIEAELIVVRSKLGIIKEIISGIQNHLNR